MMFFIVVMGQNFLDYVVSSGGKSIDVLVIPIKYPFQTDLLRMSHQTRVWGEQWMTFLGNPYVNTRCGQYALSYRLPVWDDLGMRYRGNLSGLSSIYALSCIKNLVNYYFLLEYLFITIFYQVVFSK